MISRVGGHIEPMPSRKSGQVSVRTFRLTRIRDLQHLHDGIVGQEIESSGENARTPAAGTIEKSGQVYVRTMSPRISVFA
jgi:hypothetical protein